MKNPFSGLRVALFDLDGTLIETHIDFDLMRIEVARLAGAFGMEVAPPRDILGGVAVIQEALAADGRNEEAARFRNDAYDMLREIELEHCGAPLEIPGAARLLEALDERGVAVGIVTRNCRPVSEWLLERGGLRCRCLLTRDDVERAKPDPGHLLAALAALNATTDDRRQTTDARTHSSGFQASHPSYPSHMSYPTYTTRPPNDPATCLMVGDHFMDVQAGRAAGMRTVGILRGKPKSFFDVCPPELLVEDIAELLELVEGMD